MTTRDLLLEVGTEEIPARMVAGGAADLLSLTTAALAEAGLAPASGTTVFTPRRLAVLLAGVPEAQADREEVAYGPPVSAAFGPDGQPTKAALGFARSQGVDAADLLRLPGPKGGDVVAVRRQVKGRPTADVLAALLPATLARLAFPKSMRWNGNTGPFVRPVHWICCLFGGDVIPFEFCGVASGRAMRGHRFLFPDPVDVATPDAYRGVLAARGVVGTPEERLALIRAAMDAAEQEHGFRFVRVESVLQEVANLVESPVFGIGRFDADFLRLPREVLVSAMGSHLRFFAVEGADGRLVNAFGVVSNTAARDMAVVIRGNERVLAARLYDARFFHQHDLKAGIDAMAARLPERLFLKGAGDMAEKAVRVAALSARIADAAGLGADVNGHARRTAALCKADLMSSVVGEFPDLQGVMGTYYARAQGGPEEVAVAIAEHYLPRFAGDALPAGAAGAVVAVADRVDSIATCFDVGAIPSGSRDPLALRRQAIGLLKILVARAWPAVTVKSLFEGACKDAAALDAVLAFVGERFHGILTTDHDVPSDFANALLARYADVRPAELVAMAGALRDFAKGTEGFRDFLDSVFKRVGNILKQADDKLPGWRDAAAAEGLLETDADHSARLAVDLERNVEAARLAALGAYHHARESGAYGELLSALYSFKDPLARFFGTGRDGVPVLIEEDPSKRLARVAVLARVFALFDWFADFSRISTR
ncbi:MAG: glycine--tRNA ligase subunit beta [Deltaproteobacteria bacterium]|nr:glycine--tRNA ligase subunit beta [Deltaproteobacteria bacterium]